MLWKSIKQVYKRIKRAAHNDSPPPLKFCPGGKRATASLHLQSKAFQLCIRSIDWAGLRGSHEKGKQLLPKPG